MRSFDKYEALLISKTELKKELGIIISRDMKFSAQSNKQHQMLTEYWD